MNRAGEFAKIMREVFALDYAWVDWFMREVFEDQEMYATEVDSRAAAVMLSTPYRMEFHGREVDCNYISYVATRPEFRGRGMMRSLMRQTLLDAHDAGVPFVSLIPATRPLYFIYDRLGFATVLYAKEERFTSLHTFNDRGFTAAEVTFDLFKSLEEGRRGNICHSEEDFEAIVQDLELSEGFVVAVSDGASRHAMAFAEVGDEIKVTDVLATDAEAAEAVMAEVRRRGGEKSIIAFTMPDDDHASLRSRGMMRVANVEAALGTLAEAYPSITTAIRVRDLFLPENNGIYVLKGGKCERHAFHASGIKPSMDVRAGVLTEILFSPQKIGDLFDLPTQRPYISLMLD